jgi:predicted enzyme related to lactoylglutathione lyase
VTPSTPGERRQDGGVISIVLDCADPEALTGFWAAALGWQHTGSAGAYAVLAAPDGQKLLLQHVSEPKVGKNRMHLDLHAPDIEAEATRLEGLGARRLSAARRELGSTWIVMADPEGNEFCVCDQAGDC